MKTINVQLITAVFACCVASAESPAGQAAPQAQAPFPTLEKIRNMMKKQMGVKEEIFFPCRVSPDGVILCFQQDYCYRITPMNGLVKIEKMESIDKPNDRVLEQIDVKVNLGKNDLKNELAIFLRKQNDIDKEYIVRIYEFTARNKMTVYTYSKSFGPQGYKPGITEWLVDFEWIDGKWEKVDESLQNLEPMENI